MIFLTLKSIGSLVLRGKSLSEFFAGVAYHLCILKQLSSLFSYTPRFEPCLPKCNTQRNQPLWAQADRHILTQIE